MVHDTKTVRISIRSLQELEQIDSNINLAIRILLERYRNDKLVKSIEELKQLILSKSAY